MLILLRIFGVWLLLLAMVAAVVDATKSLAGGGAWVVTPMAEQWQALNADSLAATKAWVDQSRPLRVGPGDDHHPARADLGGVRHSRRFALLAGTKAQTRRSVHQLAGVSGRSVRGNQSLTETSMFTLKRKPMSMPSAEQALPGRPQAIPTAKTHFVNGAAVQGSLPARRRDGAVRARLLLGRRAEVLGRRPASSSPRSAMPAALPPIRPMRRSALDAPATTRRCSWSTTRSR